MKRIAPTIMLGLLAAASPSLAQSDILAEISDIPLETVRSAAFALDQDQQIRLDAVGAGETGRELAANAGF
ncbi:MAG: hypothetical protein ONB46_10180 [candidate division KSB1 bacterium]|nr:hypothetical protein [candidate division KSB1 bacterium]MDZ7366172.1 hypothetical protein [candidate division KSB1 bacterium]MDZ7404186.1 hypothetical protein [candidate division KSB1 bacterium]